MPAAKRRLSVAIVSGDARRRSALAAAVRTGGHALTGDAAAADVVLVDGTAPCPPHAAVIALGNRGAGETAGHLADDASPEQLNAAIRAIAAGLAVRMREALREEANHAGDPLLTSRELEVLDALGRGLTNKAIARELDISQHTVKFHIEALFRKLDVRSRSQAVAKGLALTMRWRLDV
jgi:DNA-binding CsgD family transcriptional regulator